MNRVQNYRFIKKLEHKLNRAENLANKYKVQCFRLQRKMTNNSVSPKSTVNCDLKENKDRVSARIRKKLVFYESVTADICRIDVKNNE